MDDTGGFTILIIISVVFGGFWFIDFSDATGILMMLIGGILFFGVMLVISENADFDAIHSDW